jgi:ribonucleoside-diphosphate reductase alpha chain
LSDSRNNWPAISRHVWASKYRWASEAGIGDTWWRVARAVASVETADRDLWAGRFRDLLEGFSFLPGGRILAGAGTDRRVTLFNCFVMGTIEDTLAGIFDGLKQGAMTMQQGGGVGYDFSTLRPQGMLARTSGSIASGPVSFMKIWDAMCATMLSTGARRGAMMATLRCDHPDIESFVDAKRHPDALRHFNVSVQVTDEFMAAVTADADWPLVFPAGIGTVAVGSTVRRAWTGTRGEVDCQVMRMVRARA